ncbi:MAG: DUF4358 domain-containing protein [Clostridia bacterium]|nr:DUF4358 domain-containing protein [Clostridia bacterium]
MKRIIALLLCLITVFALASCGEEKNNDNTDTTVQETEKTLIDAAPLDIMDAIVSSYTDIPDYKKLYINGVDDLDDGYLEPEYAGYLYKGEFETLTELSMVDSYAIRLPNGKSAFEIHIMKLIDKKDVDAIKAVMQARIEQLNESDIALYDPEGFAKTIKNAEVYSVENYVFLLITSDNGIAKEAIKTALGM